MHPLPHRHRRAHAVAIRTSQELLRSCTSALRLDLRLTVTKLDLLEHVGSLALQHLGALSAQEVDLGQAYPVAAERFQYAIDKIAQAMGGEIDDLAGRWQQG